MVDKGSTRAMMNTAYLKKAMIKFDKLVVKKYQDAYDQRFKGDKLADFMAIFPELESFMREYMGLHNWLSGVKTP